MGVLSIMKYLMFLFNVLIFIGGICLLAVGIWVVADPYGFQSIVTSNPLLTAGAYIILIVGVVLSLLGFLGCYGAIRENKILLMAFFVLLLAMFIVELVGAILALTYKNQVTEQFFLWELKRNYRGDNATDVISSSWNTIMISMSCCGISGLSNFGNGSLFHELFPTSPWPDACCRRANAVLSDTVLDRTRCMKNEQDFVNPQGCFTTIAKGLQKYINITGAVGLGVLGIEMFAMFFALCLYYNFD
ncbi:tetraspanin-18-like [Ambystoma mexicanum]|uniref:tetraspanin-18-like n=1 Tax=Ambystoma mexicanum TaxID=8296 RepID=UPI0037E966F2